MRLRPSFLCPAAKLLLIFIWRDTLVSASPFGGGVTVESFGRTSGSSSYGGSGTWPTFWRRAINVGTTGSFQLLLTLLYIKLQETNSMSLPRQNLSKLHYSQIQPSFQLGSSQAKDKKNKTKKKKTKKKKNKKTKKLEKEKEGKKKNAGTKERKLLGLGKKTHVKSNSIFDTKVTSAASPGATVSKKKDRRGSISPETVLSTRYTTRYNYGPLFYSQDRRKSSRPRGNTNERFPTGYSAITSSSGITLRDILLNENEEEALRGKILAKIDELDPLMCLPKVLCGYSNRQRQIKLSVKTTTTTTTTQSPVVLDGSRIDEYLQLLKIVGPKSKHKKGGQEENEIGTIVKYSKKVKGKEKESEENDAQSESGSSESNESAENDDRYPTRKSKYKITPKKKAKPVYSKVNDDNDDDDDRNEDEEESEEDEEEEEVEEDDKEEEVEDDILDNEHVKHVIQREKMKKLMAKSEERGSDENWWDVLDLENTFSMPTTDDFAYMNALKRDPSSNESPGTFTTWMTKLPGMITRMMPTLTWKNKDDDEFTHDPFFTSFDGRGMKNGESRSLKSGLTLPSLFNSSRKHAGRGLDLEQLFGVEDSSRQRDSLTVREPGEKFRMAVELGRRLSSPSQCDFIYNACPLNYEEILAIINEPLSKTLPGVMPATVPPLPPTRNVSYVTASPPKLVIHHQQYQYPPKIQQSQPQQFHPIVIRHHPVKQPTQPAPVQHATQSNKTIKKNVPTQQTQLTQPTPVIVAETGIPSTSIIKKKTHKTTIHQELPSGEQFEINLLYGDDKGKSDTEETDPPNTTTSVAPETVDSGAEESAEVYHPPPLTAKDPFQRKVLSYANNNFSPSAGYKIKRKNGQKGKTKGNKKKKETKAAPVKSVVTTDEETEQNSSSTEEESPYAPDVQGIASDIMIRQQRPAPASPFTINTEEYGYKPMFRDIPTPPQPDSTSLEESETGNKYVDDDDADTKEEYERTTSKRKKKNKSRQDGNSIGSLDRTNDMEAQLQLLKHHQHQLEQRRKKILSQKKRRKSQPNLHKQSYKTSDAKNRLKIRGPNAIYSVYGHPLPPPYAGYYHPPTTTMSPSFLSYIFGR